MDWFPRRTTLDDVSNLSQAGRWAVAGIPAPLSIPTGLAPTPSCAARRGAAGNLRRQRADA